VAVELILAAGALILAFAMGFVVGLITTVTILVRHAQRKAAEDEANPGVSDMVANDRRRTMSEILDRPLAAFRPERKVKE
jgi:hypothetical protein